MPIIGRFESASEVFDVFLFANLVIEIPKLCKAATEDERSQAALPPAY